LSSPISTRSFVKRLLVDSDSFSILEYLSRKVPAVIAQQFIHGKPANIAVACWKGEVLAATSAVVLAVASEYGASTVSQIIENPQMRIAAERLVQRLHLSGFVGFDFVIEETSGDSYLIEMNPRFSHLATLRLGPGRDLVGALSARLFDKSLAAAPPVTTKDTIAFFPQAWLIDPRDPYIQTSYHDVPWEDPGLVRELIKIPWARRRLLSRLYHSKTRK
jgi:predicted ATP-grasp superfamily ATP-dependent carboligase